MAKKKVQIEITADNKAKKELQDTEKAADLMKDAFTAAAVVGAAKLTLEFAQLGAESLRTKRAFEAISGGADEAAARLDAMKRATRGALSEQDAMRAANQLMQMGLADSADELANVSEMAVRLGSAMGVDAKTALSDFSLLLANQSIPRLDTFGISASKVREQMADLAKQFPNMSREARFMAATMEQGEVAMGRLGDAQEDELLQIEQATAAWEDLKVTLAELVAGPITDFVSTLSDGIKVLKDLVMWEQRVADVMAEHNEETTMAAASYEDYIREMARANGVAAERFESEREFLQAMNSEAEAAELLAMQYGALTEAEFDAARAQAEMSDRVAEAARRMDDGIEPVEEFAGAIADGGTAAEEAAPLYGGLADSVTDIGSAFLNGIPSQEDFYRLMLDTKRAAGASAEELGTYATMMGVADQETVQAQLAMYELVDAYDRGERSVQDVARAAGLMEKHTAGLAKAADLEAKAQDAANEGNEEAAQLLFDQAEQERDTAEAALDKALAIADGTEAMEDAQVAAEDLTNDMDRTAMAFQRTQLEVQTLNEQIALIEREIKIEMLAIIHWEGVKRTKGPEPSYQTGTDFVPYTGVFGLHRGEAVLNPQEAAVYRQVKEDRRAFTLNYYDQGGGGGDEIAGQFSLMQAFLGG